MTPILYFTSLAILGGLLYLIVWVNPKKPTHNRNWKLDYAVMPKIEMSGQEVTVHDLRDFRYGQVGDSGDLPEDIHVAYDTRTYDLDRLESLWLVLESFSRFDAVAHTLLSFGFSDGRYLAVSIEARIPEGERYDLLRGLFKTFELVYLFGDERDLIARRAKVLDHDVYLYPIRATPGVIKDLLLSYLRAADKLTEQPRFYNSLFDNCTSGIVKHVTEVDPSALSRYTVAQIAPGWSDRILYSRNLIDTELPFGALRAHFNIKETAARFANDLEFSARIRAGL